MKDDKLIERVRKLYTMSQDASSPNEAAIAARRARSLMDEHSLTLADLQKSEFAKNTINGTYRSVPTHRVVLTHAVGRYNDCLVHMFSDGQTTFKGFKADTIGAELMLDYLIQVQERSLRACKQDYGHMSRGETNAFRVGYACQMRNRLDDLVEERQADVKTSTGTDLVANKQAMVESHFGVIKHKGRGRKISFSSGTAFQAGCIAANNTSLNKQAAHSAAPRLS